LLLLLTTLSTPTFTLRVEMPEPTLTRISNLVLIQASRKVSRYSCFPNNYKSPRTGKHEVHNDIVGWLDTDRSGRTADLIAAGVGKDFVSNLVDVIFPLPASVRCALNNGHHGGGPAPEPAFKKWFDKRFMGKKGIPWTTMVVSLQELWIGSHHRIAKGWFV